MSSVIENPPQTYELDTVRIGHVTFSVHQDRGLYGILIDDGVMKLFTDDLMIIANKVYNTKTGNYCINEQDLNTMDIDCEQI